jgi:hypothetical protein
MEGRFPLIGVGGFEEAKEYVDATEMGDEGPAGFDKEQRTDLLGVTLTIVQRMDIRADHIVRVKHTSRR